MKNRTVVHYDFFHLSIAQRQLIIQICVIQFVELQTHRSSSPMHFDLTDIILMTKVAEANSLTKGADAMHLSVSAASTRIKNLESLIGAQLLLRTPQGVSLTPSGNKFVQHARIVLRQMERLSSDMQEYAKGIKGRMVEAGVGIGVMPESAAQRHARVMRIAIVPLRDSWALRQMHVCVRDIESLPGFARELVALLAEDSNSSVHG